MAYDQPHTFFHKPARSKTLKDGFCEFFQFSDYLAKKLIVLQCSNVCYLFGTWKCTYIEVCIHGSAGVQPAIFKIVVEKVHQGKKS